MADMKDLLVEIGTEELPPKALKSLGLAFRDGIVGGLDERELSHGDVRWFAAPRRLAVLVRDVAEQAADKILEVLGPPADRAKDGAGEWTPADALGYARILSLPGSLQTRAGGSRAGHIPPSGPTPWSKTPGPLEIRVVQRSGRSENRGRRRRMG